MRGRIDFYALKNDLLLLLCCLEASHPVVYAEFGRLQSESPRTFNSGAELPKIGQATGSQHVTCDMFLIVPADAQISVSSSVMFDGVRRFDADQSTNPDSVVLSSGGEWTDGSLISGSITTISNGAFPQALMRAAHRAVKRDFTRVNAYWVGPRALVSFRSGTRLCSAIQSPPEYDLREPAVDIA